ncbi:putative integral membrane protein [Brugia pahangi]
MRRWSTDTACVIHASLFLVTIALAPLYTVAEYSQVFLREQQDATLNLPTKCGMYGQKLFCLSINLCNKYCSQQCSEISSFELRNLQILSPKERRIQKLRHNIPLDTSLRINYYDIEMEGMKPAFCGDYSTLELPIYSVKESKSNGIQFLRKLYFQNYRDVYTHSMCNYKCVFGCHRVGYDEEIVSELLIRSVPNLHVYQCDSVHSWVFIAVVIVVFINLLIFITCFVRNKMSSIHGNTEEVYVD